MASDKKSWFARHKFLTAIGVFILLIVIVSSTSGDKKTDTVKSSTTNTSQTETKQPEEKKISLQEFYDQVQTGQEKAAVDAIAPKKPSSCTEMEDPYTGKTESCLYASFMDGGSVSITYSNGKVSSKLKMEF